MAENSFACKILVVSLYFQNDVHQAPAKSQTPPDRKKNIWTAMFICGLTNIKPSNFSYNQHLL